MDSNNVKDSQSLGFSISRFRKLRTKSIDDINKKLDVFIDRPWEANKREEVFDKHKPRLKPAVPVMEKLHHLSNETNEKSDRIRLVAFLASNRLLLFSKAKNAVHSNRETLSRLLSERSVSVVTHLLSILNVNHRKFISLEDCVPAVIELHMDWLAIHARVFAFLSRPDVMLLASVRPLTHTQVDAILVGFPVDRFFSKNPLVLVKKMELRHEKFHSVDEMVAAIRSYTQSKSSDDHLLPTGGSNSLETFVQLPPVTRTELDAFDSVGAARYHLIEVLSEIPELFTYPNVQVTAFQLDEMIIGGGSLERTLWLLQRIYEHRLRFSNFSELSEMVARLNDIYELSAESTNTSHDKPHDKAKQSSVSRSEERATAWLQRASLAASLFESDAILLNGHATGDELAGILEVGGGPASCARLVEDFRLDGRLFDSIEALRNAVVEARSGLKHSGGAMHHLFHSRETAIRILPSLEMHRFRGSSMAPLQTNYEDEEVADVQHVNKLVAQRTMQELVDKLLIHQPRPTHVAQPSFSRLVFSTAHHEYPSVQIPPSMAKISTPLDLSLLINEGGGLAQTLVSLKSLVKSGSTFQSLEALFDSLTALKHPAAEKHRRILRRLHVGATNLRTELTSKFVSRERSLWATPLTMVPTEDHIRMLEEAAGPHIEEFLDGLLLAGATFRSLSELRLMLVNIESQRRQCLLRDERAYLGHAVWGSARSIFRTLQQRRQTVQAFAKIAIDEAELSPALMPRYLSDAEADRLLACGGTLDTTILLIKQLLDDGHIFQDSAQLLEAMRKALASLVTAVQQSMELLTRPGSMISDGLRTDLLLDARLSGSLAISGAHTAVSVSHLVVESMAGSRLPQHLLAMQAAGCSFQTFPSLMSTAKELQLAFSSSRRADILAVRAFLRGPFCCLLPALPNADPPPARRLLAQLLDSAPSAAALLGLWCREHAGETFADVASLLAAVKASPASYLSSPEELEKLLTSPGCRLLASCTASNAKAAAEALAAEVGPLAPALLWLLSAQGAAFLSVHALLTGVRGAHFQSLFPEGGARLWLCTRLFVPGCQLLPREGAINSLESLSELLEIGMDQARDPICALSVVIEGLCSLEARGKRFQSLLSLKTALMDRVQRMRMSREQVMRKLCLLSDPTLLPWPCARVDDLLRAVGGIGHRVKEFLESISISSSSGLWIDSAAREVECIFFTSFLLYVILKVFYSGFIKGSRTASPRRNAFIAFQGAQSKSNQIFFIFSCVFVRRCGAN
jgi:hypothetical protein